MSALVIIEHLMPVNIVYTTYGGLSLLIFGYAISRVALIHTKDFIFA